MSKFVLGQRYISEPEPELGLGVVTSVDGFRVGIEFPAAGEQRLYASDTPILKRATFRSGERLATRAGIAFAVAEVEEEDGLLYYLADEVRACESEISDVTSFSKPQERLMNGQVDSNETFDLRLETLRGRSRLRQSPVRGFMGGRVDLIPHQMYILHEVSSRQIPRVLLSDEVGLGKTIEACLILQRLKAIGRAERVLILVPESLVHQWFVELLRRFNMWFSIFDEERCRAAEKSNQDGNPFLDEQLILCNVSYLAHSEVRREQAVEAGWDIVVVDEAHHLEWTEESSSPEYDLVEQLGGVSPGLLLLTATPTQLGLEGHFARLRLLDPDRYGNIEAFRDEAEDFGEVAAISGKILDEEILTAADRESLRRIFHRDLSGLESRLKEFDLGKSGSKESLLKALLDEHGTGRVVFRNSRSNMRNFPKRRYCPAPLMDEDSEKSFLKKVAKELEAEGNDDESKIRYSFKGDVRMDWLVTFIKARRGVKMLIICKSRQKAIAIDAALKDALNVKAALFHEDLALVQRDRNAAWFSEEEGAQLLICSEIGSEGRNFQFAHHLILFDLPLNPALLEQRIGRLDRIGQKETIQIHVPYIVGSSQEFVAEWYHQGLDAFESCLHGAVEYVSKYRSTVLESALQYGDGRKSKDRTTLEAFIQETSTFRVSLDATLKKGRDRLLELNSFDEKIASEVVQSIRKAESDEDIRRLLFDLFEFYGVRVDEHECGDVYINASHAYVEAFPSVDAEGMLATFARSRAIVREDMSFVSMDHPLISDTFDLLINSERGTATFALCESDSQNLLLEAVFELETVSLSKLHLDRFLSPTPIRILVDIRGNNLTHERDSAWLRANAQNGSINRFLERPGFSREFLDAMVVGAESLAEKESRKLKATARATMKKSLMGELERLIDLQKINENVTDDEISSLREEIAGIQGAIDQARLRLDSIRLIVEGSIDGLDG